MLWQHARAYVLIALEVIALLFTVGLDVRDFYYKCFCLGPLDSFSIFAQARLPLKAHSLRQQQSQTAIARRASGWSSLLANCSDLQPFESGPGFFLSALGTNCSIGATATSAAVVSQLIVIADMRVDALACTACSLLYLGRKQMICQDEIVTGFRQRYQVWHSIAQIAEPHSMAEDELLQLLDLISVSAPLHSVVCFEAFEYNYSQRTYSPNLYGCSSPNINASVIAGRHATALFSLLHDKAWLTVDRLQVLGVGYYLRQNCISAVEVASEGVAIGAITHKTHANYSSSGSMFVIMVIIDVSMLIVKLQSNLEIAQLMISPMVDISNQVKRQDLKTFFACSVFRSHPVRLVSVASQIIAWVLVIPNAMVWTWTDQTSGKVQAFLSTLRIWVLVLLLVNQTWDYVVLAAEPTAYKVIKQTYVASLELVFITIAAVYVFRQRLFSIAEVKYALEHQRHADAKTFDGWVAFGNAFEPETEYPSNSTWAVVYEPLGVILLSAVLSCFALATVRWLYYQFRPGCRRRTGCRSPQTKSSAPSSSLIPEVRSAAIAPFSPPRLLHTEPTGDRAYVRLPIEEHLDLPMRARNLVRDGIALETVMHGTIYLLPAQYLGHGVVVENGRFLRTRRGFPTALPLRVFVSDSEEGKVRVLDLHHSGPTIGRQVKLRHRSSFHPLLR